jgi:hexosaminidase
MGVEDAEADSVQTADGAALSDVSAASDDVTTIEAGGGSTGEAGLPGLGSGEASGCPDATGVTTATAPTGPDAGPGGSLAGLVPIPHAMTSQSGEFVLTADTSIGLRDPANQEERSVAGFVAKFLAGVTGFSLPMIPADQEICFPGSPVVEFALDATIANPEGYRLRVQPLHVSISASTAAGLFYGAQTLRQMLPPAIESSAVVPGARWSVPSVAIEDAPRLPYRGMQLDVSRHFFPVAFVEKYIDVLAMYKMNRFHWHLTDDQGWRVEIKKYPKLTSVGAWRTEATGATYGGFYTQAEIAEVRVFLHRRPLPGAPYVRQKAERVLPHRRDLPVLG